jgi:hypothetical protein
MRERRSLINLYHSSLSLDYDRREGREFINNRKAATPLARSRSGCLRRWPDNAQVMPFGVPNTRLPVSSIPAVLWSELMPTLCHRLRGIEGAKRSIFAANLMY